MVKITEPSYRETLNYLEMQPERNLNIIHFMENYRIVSIKKCGGSRLVVGCSDNNWTYISSADVAELAVLVKQVGRTEKNYAAIESWMLPLITPGRKISWRMSAKQFVLPATVKLPADSSSCSELTPQDGAFIYEQMDYKDVASLKYVEERIISGVSAAIYEQGQPAAWAATHDDGALGMLYVLPAYRTRGYATAVLISLIEKVRTAGNVPYAQIEEDNHKSLNLMKKLGFVYHKDVHWLKMK